MRDVENFGLCEIPNKGVLDQCHEAGLTSLSAATSLHFHFTFVAHDVQRPRKAIWTSEDEELFVVQVVIGNLCAARRHNASRAKGGALASAFRDVDVPTFAGEVHPLACRALGAHHLHRAPLYHLSMGYLHRAVVDPKAASCVASGATGELPMLLHHCTILALQEILALKAVWARAGLHDAVVHGGMLHKRMAQKKLTCGAGVRPATTSIAEQCLSILTDELGRAHKVPRAGTHQHLAIIEAGVIKGESAAVQFQCCGTCSTMLSAFPSIQRELVVVAGQRH
mmetsp:Transcript_13341/g.31707  ORF Transcript_13341/g.31707 Transcript_13341/m.31707 type:complete len:282 (-) Transcript_13341:1259-2104(-)